MSRSASAHVEDDQDEDDHEEEAQQAELHEAPAFRASATKLLAVNAAPLSGRTASLPTQRVSFLLSRTRLTPFARPLR